MTCFGFFLFSTNVTNIDSLIKELELRKAYMWNKVEEWRTAM